MKTTATLKGLSQVKVMKQRKAGTLYERTKAVRKKTQERTARKEQHSYEWKAGFTADVQLKRQ